MAEFKILEEVVFVSMDKLEPMDGNPRKMTEIEREDLANSILEFGFVDPLIVWAGVFPSKPRKKWKVIGGHQRLDVLKELIEAGKEDSHIVPVVKWFGSEEKALKLNLALNRIGGDWDYVALKDWFAKIEEKGDLELTGFTAEEIDFVVQAEDGILADLKQPSFMQLSVFEHPSLDVGGERTEGRTLETVELPVASVKRNKFNPSQMSGSRFQALKKNIEALGLLYPILVRDAGDGTYEIIDGEKRHAAFEEMEKATIPAIVTEMADENAVLASLTANRLQGSFKGDDLRKALFQLSEIVGEGAVSSLLDMGSQMKDYLDPAKVEEAQSWAEFMEGLSEEEREIISGLVDAETTALKDLDMILMIPLSPEQHQFAVEAFDGSGKPWGNYLIELLGGIPDGEVEGEAA